MKRIIKPIEAFDRLESPVGGTRIAVVYLKFENRYENNIPKGIEYSKSDSTIELKVPGSYTVSSVTNELIDDTKITELENTILGI